MFYAVDKNILKHNYWHTLIIQMISQLHRGSVICQDFDFHFRHYQKFTHTYTHTHTHIYIYILVKLPWPENPANTYMWHTGHWTALSNLLGLISSAYCDLHH